MIEERPLFPYQDVNNPRSLLPYSSNSPTYEAYSTQFHPPNQSSSQHAPGRPKARLENETRSKEILPAVVMDMRHHTNKHGRATDQEPQRIDYPPPIYTIRRQRFASGARRALPRGRPDGRRTSSSRPNYA